MKYTMFSIWILFPLFLFAQTGEEMDFVVPAEDGFAAVKKANQWGFINGQGDLVVPFRSDIVAGNTTKELEDIGVAGIYYPVMLENRCIVRELKNGIVYFGYINGEGEMVVKPQFLNVSNFKNGFALALRVEEKVLGKNEPLGKRVVSYAYDVVLIDQSGEVVKFLTGPFPIALSKEKLKVPPPILAKDISENLIAVKTPGNRWKLFNIDK